MATAFAFLLAGVNCGDEGARPTHQSLELVESRLYFHQEFSAGPTIIEGSGGQIVDERRFEPFGQLIDADRTTDPFNSLNKETYREKGWSYHGAR